MTHEEIEIQAEKLERCIPKIMDYLEKIIKKEYENDGERVNFALTIGVNVLGNLIGAASRDKEDVIHSYTEQTIFNLMKWSKILISRLKELKEMH